MLNLSGVSIGGGNRQQQHGFGSPHQQQQQQQPTFPDVSSVAATAGTAAMSGGGSPGSSGVEVLFEDEVPVILKNMDREEVCQVLGVTVQLSKNGPYRAVHVRVTDPKDPFFLYNMALSEDDYGRFKEGNELAVDFAGFPRDLVAMLSSAQALPSTHMMNAHHAQQQQQQHAIDSSTTSTSVGGPTLLTFTISNNVDGTLRILERTSFRKVEHLLLTMVRQGDVGQKQYLAERFRHFLRAFNTSDQQRRGEFERSSKQIGDLTAALEQARAELDGLRQTGAVAASEHKLALSNTTERMRQSHDEQLRSLQAERDSLIEAQAKQHASEMSRAQADIAQALERLERAAQQVQQLESERLRLSTELAHKSEHLSTATQENLRLQERSDELGAFQRRANHEKTEMEKMAVATEERLKHITDLLRVRDEETSQLRRQTDSAESNLRRSNDQLDVTRKKLDETETSLAKAHHIITTHLATLKGKQEKIKAMEAALSTADKRVHEKEMDVERIRLETQADRDKCETLTSRCTELKEQLQRAEEQNTTLATDLKQSQEALMHLGRSASSMPNRAWSSHTGGGGPNTSSSMAGGQHQPLSSSSFAPAPISLMREFARGSGGGAGGDMSSASAAAGSGGGQFASTSAAGGMSSSYGMSSSRMPYSATGAGGGGFSSMSSTPSGAAGGRTPAGGIGSVGGGSSDFKSMLRNTASASGSTPGATSAYFPSA